MQFIKDGPEIPEDLLQAHEDEKLIFFCGAGISKPAGFPLFDGLVEQIYCTFNKEHPITEQELERPEEVISQLESETAGGRETVRKEIAKILGKEPKTTETHEALLKLAKCHISGKTRLVTTNFDRIFQEVIEKKSLSIKYFQAPTLPRPKENWEGLIYLHGLLPFDISKTSDLDNLVVSSGDFGQAYLTDRWAARFVRELFRNNIICFVGYSANDPIMQYMLHANAADPEYKKIFAFSEHSEKARWRSKNVTPIIYEKCNNHYYLHKTLKEWSEIYKKGAEGKKLIVKEAVSKDPDDYYASRLLWALKDKSGKTAKIFANLDTAPSLDWLDKLKSLFESSSDKVIRQMILWLMHHLNDRRALNFVARSTGQLRETMDFLIENHLEKLAELEEKTGEIYDDYLDSHPKPLVMYRLWRLLLAGRVEIKDKDNMHIMDLYHWHENFKKDGLTIASKIKLRKILTPKIIKPKGLLEYDIGLPAAKYFNLGRLSGDKKWVAALPELLPDFVSLLREALDIMRDLERANDKSDDSYIIQPSISKHKHKRIINPKSWGLLIELTSEAWLELAKKSPEKAASEAKSWLNISYPVFRRLAFFAASQDNIIPTRTALDWLLSDKKHWLWSEETLRETIRLLVALTPKLDKSMLNELETAILTGPPPGIFRDSLSENSINYKICLRLKRFEEAGAVLSEDSQNKLKEILKEYPNWKLSSDQSEEFPFRIGNVVKGGLTIIATPLSRKELIEWLKKHPKDTFEQGSDWRERCTNDFSTTVCALLALANENIWLTERWSHALNVWSEEKKLAKRSWRYLAPVLNKAPDDVLQKLARWLEAVAKVLENHKEIFLSLSKRILKYQNDETPKINLGYALNHSIGIVTQALLNLWQKNTSKDNQQIPKEIKAIFTELCNTKNELYRYGRIILASNLNLLFDVDPEWTEKHLLPLFDWNKSEIEASAVWEGFLWLLIFSCPLIEKIKMPLLDTVSHYEKIGSKKAQYAKLIISIAPECPNICIECIKAQLRKVIKELPEEGRFEALTCLIHKLKNTDEKEYWRNKIKPLFEDQKGIWPTEKIYHSAYITQLFAELCIEAKEGFPDAFKILKKWLKEYKVESLPTSQMQEYGLCEKFPKDVLGFLDLMLDEKIQHYAPKALKDCLKQIIQADPCLENDNKYKKLKNSI